MQRARSMSAADRPKRQIILSAFDMHTVSHQAPGMWTHPDDQSRCYTDLDYWTDLAQRLERGGFDCLFIADVLGAYDVYEGSRDAAVRTAAQTPVNDPMMAISAMAAVTERLCFGVTVSLTYELPYAFARKMSTLDHLTKGRIAWNIVTSYQQSAAVNLGLDRQIPHDERYDIADEFLEVCYKLWESSWEDEAVIRDRSKGIFTDPSKVHDIDHQGKYYTVPGAHLSEPSPQRTPFLFQAGASARGRMFAAQHAEAVFLTGTNPEDMRPVVDLLRMQIAEQGRDPRQVKIIMMLAPITGADDSQAQKKLAEVLEHGSHDAALALFGGWSGVDLAKTPRDLPIQKFQGDSVRAISDMLTRIDSELEWTTERLADWLCLGGMSAATVGSPSAIVDEMERWIEIADVDGFNLARVTTPGTMDDFIELVVPELRRRGHIPEIPLPAMTMRERFGGTRRLADGHPGSFHRFGFEGTRQAPPVTLESRPRKVGLYVTFEAKPGMQDELIKWLRDSLALVMDEPGTNTWYAFRLDDTTFGIFDTFDDEIGRHAHINGRVTESLGQITAKMLVAPPQVRQIDVLAAKYKA
jgi:FMN-dependent oxidoreductase (nitrilotriacetate monooxygenase family)